MRHRVGAPAQTREDPALLTERGLSPGKREIDRTVPKRNSVLVEASSIVVKFPTHG